jgi:virginiamycin B lyase
MQSNKICTMLMAGFGLLLAAPASALNLTVTNEAGQPLASVMVRAQSVNVSAPANWHGKEGDRTSGKVQPEFTWFTNAAGWLNTPAPYPQLRLQLRSPGYQSLSVDKIAGNASLSLKLKRETDPAALAASRPANAWFSQLDLGDETLKKHFALQCAFCHQQGNAFLRAERSPEQWDEVIARMITYGSRLATDAQKSLPKTLSEGYRDLREHPEKIPAGTPWPGNLHEVTITEWPIGDAMSQMHDLLTHSNGKVYVGDNLKDDLIEIDPVTGEYSIYKLPRSPDDKPGGLLGARLRAFPQHETYVGLHSFAESPKDGHIFMTCSVQQRLIEFAPESKTFTVHQFDEGYYPHTLRFDAQDRVWFTVALSNQVAVLDRKTGKFSFIDLPIRNLRERITVALVGVILKLADWGLPLNKLGIDFQSSGLPLPYGIEVAPDGSVWFARLYADDIGRVDPETHEVTMIKTPFMGPRRLRADADSKLWIAAFPESAIAKYDPATGVFTRYDMPVVPLGSDTPYSLNVDRQRGIVWVDGNQSDSVLAFDIAKESWQFIPLPRAVSFTRDVEITPDGTAWTSNSSFPSWHIEGAQPTLIRIEGVVK